MLLGWILLIWCVIIVFCRLVKLGFQFADFVEGVEIGGNVFQIVFHVLMFLYILPKLE